MDTKTVFMIEDETLLCDLFSEYIETMPGLKFLGFEQDGGAGIKKALDLAPDLIVLDIRLPEVNGLEVLSLLRQRLPQTGIILFTGTVKEETLRLAKRLGAHAFVEKSQGLEDLKRAIDAVGKGERYYSPNIQILMEQFHLD
jgi:DNA-binding NarL/FixJ family response regulator